MTYIALTPQEIDYIGRVVETEVPRDLRAVDPIEYERMVGAVVDTITNRLETGRFGKTITEVLNQDRAFSKIAGPSRLNPYGTVDKAPKASKGTQQVVNAHISQRASGKPSLIGGAVNYANPHSSDQRNLTGWINPMIEAGAVKMGAGKSVHYHGTAPGSLPAGYYELGKPFGFMPPVMPGQPVASNAIPTPTPRPQVDAPAFGARAARELQGYAPPPSPAAGTRAASGLQEYAPQGVPIGPVERGGALPPAMPSRTRAEQNAINDYTYYGLTRSRAPATPVGRQASVQTAPAPTMAPPLSAPRSIIDRPIASPVPSTVAPPPDLSITMPQAAPSRSVQTQSVPPTAIGSFPEAPPSPGRRAATDVAKGAAMGAVTGGLPGMIMGALIGPARAQIGRNIASNRTGLAGRINPFNGVLGAYRGLFSGLGGLGGMFTGIPAPNYSAPSYSVGSGYGPIGSVFGAPAGATALSRSNPEVSFTSLGNGYVSRSNSLTGTSYTMSASDYDPGIGGGGKGSGGKGGGGKK